MILKIYFIVILGLVHGIILFPLSDQALPTPELIVTYGSPVQMPGYLHWSNDSKTLIFADVVTLPTDEWYSYNVDLKILKASPSLSENNTILEKNCPLIQSYFQPNGQEIPASISPNERFLTYIAEQAHSSSVRLGIADCEKVQSFTLSDTISPIDRVLWSEDSEAFVTIDVFYPETYINYVSNYADDVTRATLRNLRNWSSHDRNYTVMNAFDISSNGNLVLLLVRQSVSDFRLYLYNERTPSRDIVIDDFNAEHVIAGTFAPQDETKLWLLGEEGVVQYDLHTGETTLIDSRVTAIGAQNVPTDTPALFSPDGNFLAVLQESGLYIVDLSKHTPAITSATPEVALEDKALERLILAVDCPSIPQNTITWHILNPNAEAVHVEWSRSGIYEESNRISIPGENQAVLGKAMFKTPVDFTGAASLGGVLSTVSIYVDGIFHDQRACFVPRGE